WHPQTCSAAVASRARQLLEPTLLRRRLRDHPASYPTDGITHGTRSNDERGSAQHFFSNGHPAYKSSPLARCPKPPAVFIAIASSTRPRAPSPRSRQVRFAIPAHPKRPALHHGETTP